MQAGDVINFALTPEEPVGIELTSEQKRSVYVRFDRLRTMLGGRSDDFNMLMGGWPSSEGDAVVGDAYFQVDQSDGSYLWIVYGTVLVNGIPLSDPSIIIEEHAPDKKLLGRYRFVTIDDVAYVWGSEVDPEDDLTYEHASNYYAVGLMTLVDNQAEHDKNSSRRTLAREAIDGIMNDYRNEQLEDEIGYGLRLLTLEEVGKLTHVLRQAQPAIPKGYTE